MPNALKLASDIARLREAIEKALTLYPEFKPLGDDINVRGYFARMADRPLGSREPMKITDDERELANLREGARVLIARHPDVATLFEHLGSMVAPEPTAGTALTGKARSMSRATSSMEATLAAPRGQGGSVALPKAKTARKRGGGARPKTKVGRAVLANSVSIVLSAQAAISLIEITIESLKAERINDPDAPSNTAIISLETIIGELRNIQTSLESFREEKVPETKLPGAFENFRGAFSAFWEKDGEKFIGKSASIGLIAAGTALLQLAGMPSMGAGLVASAVCAGDPVAKVLRAAKGLWPSSN